MKLRTAFLWQMKSVFVRGSEERALLEAHRIVAKVVGYKDSVDDPLLREVAELAGEETARIDQTTWLHVCHHLFSPYKSAYHLLHADVRLGPLVDDAVQLRVFEHLCSVFVS